MPTLNNITFCIAKARLSTEPDRGHLKWAYFIGPDLISIKDNIDFDGNAHLRMVHSPKRFTEELQEVTQEEFESLLNSRQSSGTNTFMNKEQLAMALGFLWLKTLSGNTEEIQKVQFLQLIIEELPTKD